MTDGNTPSCMMTPKAHRQNGMPPARAPRGGRRGLWCNINILMAEPPSSD